MNFYIKCFILFSFLSGCSAAPVFSVKTEPTQADVFYLDKSSKEKKLLGKSPLLLPMEELKEKLGDLNAGEFFTLSIEKEGLLTQTLVIPATQFGSSVSDLDIKLTQGEMVEEKRKAKEVLDQVFLAQRFALSQQFERAQIELDKILFQFPDFANAMSMRAAIFYAQKNYPESIKWYEKAIKADPKMEEAIKMLAKIKSGKTGDKSPASENAEAKGTKK